MNHILPRCNWPEQRHRVLAKGLGILHHNHGIRVLRQFATGRFRDPLLRMLATPDLGAISQGERRLLLDTCFRSNHVTMLAPFPHYQSLHDLYQMLAAQGESAYRYLSRDYFSDLVTWYHLAWTGETERRRNPLIANLMSQGEGYAYDDRRQYGAPEHQRAHPKLPFAKQH